MNRLKYWIKRAELAENIVKGWQNTDVRAPAGLFEHRIKPWMEFLATQAPAEMQLDDLGMFERMFINAGTSLMRVPGGHVLEYWDRVVDTQIINKKITQSGQRPIVTSCVFIPENVDIQHTEIQDISQVSPGDGPGSQT